VTAISYLLDEFTQVFAVEDDRTSSARPESDVMILSCLEDEMTTLSYYSRPAIKFISPSLDTNQQLNNKEYIAYHKNQILCFWASACRKRQYVFKFARCLSVVLSVRLPRCPMQRRDSNLCENGQAETYASIDEFYLVYITKTLAAKDEQVKYGTNIVLYVTRFLRTTAAWVGCTLHSTARHSCQPADVVFFSLCKFRENR